MEAESFTALGASLARDMRTAAIYVDAEGVIRFWNDGARELFGHAAGDAIGNSPKIIIPTNLRSAHGVCFDRAMQSGWSGSSNWDALEALHESGELIAVEVFLLPIGSAANPPNGALAFFRRRDR